MDIVPIDSSFPAQTASYTGTAGVTSGWPVGPKGVWVFVTSDAYVAVGSAVTATTADTPIPANKGVTIAVPPGGETFRVSAIQVAAGGSVYARPVAGA